MKRFLAVIFLLTIGAVQAQESGEARYQRCLSLTQTNAQNAYDEALIWRDTGGGAPADHCAALALVTLKHYRDAAGILDSLSQNEGTGGAELRAEIAGQAGSAWMLAGRPQEAEKSFSRVLNFNPSDTDTRIDRAMARAKVKNWKGADEDLTAILERNPARTNLLLLRASARHANGSIAGAWADLEAVLKLKPNDPAALIERGAIRYETGDVAGARVDWQKIIEVAPGTAEAKAARKQLQTSAGKPKPQFSPSKTSAAKAKTSPAPPKTLPGQPKWPAPAKPKP